MLAHLGDAFQEVLRHLSDLVHRTSCQGPGKVGGHGPDVGGYGHLVVVENHDQPVSQFSALIETLQSQAGGHGTIADDGYHLTFFPQVPHRLCYAESGRDGGTAMPDVEHIVGTFLSLGETTDPASRAKGVELVPSAGYQFVGVGLMPHIPDDLVLRHLENVMKGQGQFHSSQVRCQMTAVDGNHLENGCPYLACQLLQLLDIQFPQIGRGVYERENGLFFHNLATQNL